MTILFVTTGMPIYKHYCNDELKSFSLFADLTISCCSTKTPVKCIETNKSPNSCSTSDVNGSFTTPTFSKKKCCSNQFDYSKTCVNANLIQKLGMPFYTCVFFFLNLRGEYMFNLNISHSHWESKVKLSHLYPPSNIPLFLFYGAFLC